MEQNSDEIGGAPSEIGRERAGIKRLKVEKNEDRISALPDSLIHHILSFLPSTKHAIRTGILSKRWQNQWTRVPVLIFHSIGKSDENFSQFIDATLTLHDCSKLQKFHIQYDDKLGCDPHLTSKIRFAIRKNVEELILHLSPLDENLELGDVYKLPKFLFSNASLVKLELFNCCLLFNRKRIDPINWSRLKELKLDCSSLNAYSIQHVVSGSPLLESLELTGGIQSPNVVIASESLKRLIFVDVECERGRDRIEFFCPNLEELSFNTSEHLKSLRTHLPNKTIENVLSRSPLLHMLELQYCFCPERLVIASNSLKKLVFGEIYGTSDYEILCPNLEEVNLYRFVPRIIFSISDVNLEYRSRPQRLAMKILQQLQHVNLLEMGSWLIKILSAWELGDWEFENRFSPLLNCKCLTLNGAHLDEHFPGVVYAIRGSPALEKLVIKFHPDQPLGLLDLNEHPRRKNNWNSYGTDFNCPLSNFKTIKIIGLPKEDDKLKFLFNFVEFMLKNAIMLEKIVIIVPGCGASVPFEDSKKLLSFQRCFPRTTIELLSSS